MLSALAIENAKPREKPYKLSDGNGLYLLVTPGGSKLWRLRYRFAGAQKMLSLATFPAVSLAMARAKRDDAQKLLAIGIDPSQQRKQDRIAAATEAQNTFGAIATEHIATLVENGAAEKTLAKMRWLLHGLAAPLAGRPIAQITPAEILAILKKVEKSGRRETAVRLRGAIGKIFRIAIATLRAPTDPTYALRDALAGPIVTHRAAITNERELGALMVAIDEYDGWPTLRGALLFLALTMTRPGEVRHLRRGEIVWQTATWKIPAERMKMRRPHEVPLSTQALAVLRSVWNEDGQPNALIFPSIRSAVKPLSENALNSALRRMGYAKEEMSSHGFRSSASTILNERGYDPDVIEAALAHQHENVVRAAYNRSHYWPQRVKLLQDWADLLDQFRILSAVRTPASSP